MSSVDISYTFAPSVSYTFPAVEMLKCTTVTLEEAYLAAVYTTDRRCAGTLLPYNTVH